MANVTPKQVLGLAAEKKATYVDLKFMDFIGMWQHFTDPARRADGGHLRGGARLRRLVHPRLAGNPRVRHAGVPDPATATIDPFMAEPDALAHLQRRRPHHEGAVLARPAQHRHQGGEVPQVDRHRRRGLLRPGGRSSSSSTRSATTPA